MEERPVILSLLAQLVELLLRVTLDVHSSVGLAVGVATTLGLRVRRPLLVLRLPMVASRIYAGTTLGAGPGCLAPARAGAVVGDVRASA